MHRPPGVSINAASGLDFSLLGGKPSAASRFDGFHIQGRCFAAVYSFLDVGP